MTRLVSELPPIGDMSLRDWFAGQALVGILTVNTPTRLDDPSPALAAAAFIMADAMMAERAKRGEGEG